jgi:dTDP-4-dehydrorhamnose 3,5-epimerase
MIFRATRVPGAFVVEPEPATDERGFFARTWCRETFAARGLAADLDQCSVSYNRRRHTLRGLHFQAAPHEEAKLVRCTRGRLFDVVVDLRPGSPARGRWDAAELDAESHRALYVPPGCAHGFLTLADDTVVFYQIAGAHAPAAARGVRWDDPDLAIDWPADAPILSERDRALPTLAEITAATEAA